MVDDERSMMTHIVISEEEFLYSKHQHPDPAPPPTRALLAAREPRVDLDQSLEDFLATETAEMLEQIDPDHEPTPDPLEMVTMVSCEPGQITSDDEEAVMVPVRQSLTEDDGVEYNKKREGLRLSLSQSSDKVLTKIYTICQIRNMKWL